MIVTNVHQACRSAQKNTRFQKYRKRATFIFLLRACWGFSVGGKNEGFFGQFFSFLKEQSGATRLKKGKKWRKKNRFWPNGKISNMLLNLFISECQLQQALCAKLHPGLLVQIRCRIHFPVVLLLLHELFCSNSEP